jgi:hypothetical protein
VGAIGRTGPVASELSENRCPVRPVASDWSGGVGLLCGMKRGITDDAPPRSEVHYGGPTWLTEMLRLCYLTFVTASVRKP